MFADPSRSQYPVSLHFRAVKQAIGFSLKCLQLAIFIFAKPRKNACFRIAEALLLGALLVGHAPQAWAGAAISATARRQSDALYQSAYAAYAAADYPHSLQLLDSAETARPDFADGFNLRGIIYLRQGAYDKAEAAFSRAVALDANLWAAQFNLGEIPFREKSYAVARSRFEKLLAHTNRFKARNQWELVQYKAYLCTLLAGDATAAQKNLDRLPAKDGATPAYQYAQAALALSKKDNAGAARWLSTAQTSYNPTLNNLFSDSLGVAGWASALPARTALALAGQTSPAFDPRRSQTAYLDPRLEASVAEPLPAADGGILPMLPPGRRPGFRLLPESTTPTIRDYVPTEPAPTPAAPVSGLDNGGLLLLN